MAQPPEIPPEILEALRQKSGLSIDLEGRFLHRGEPITHARTLEVLWRSLTRLADGRYQVAIGREQAYLTLEDTAYVIRGAQVGPGGVVLHLSDGSREDLDPNTLGVGRDGALRCQVKGDHPARFSRSAQVEVGLALEEDSAAPTGFTLRLGERRFPLFSLAAPAPRT
jgi:hypothetical protein